MPNYTGPRFVLGVDPGLMSGLALYDTQTGSFDMLERGFESTGDALEEFASQYKSELAIATEHFIITMQTAKNTQATWSLELIGAARHIARRNDCKFKLQMVAAAKRFGDDEKLRRLGWYRRGLSHGRDAARHTLLYLVEHGWWDERIVRATED